MSWVERSFCQSRLWNPISNHYLQWALGKQQLQGNVLEIGSGNGKVAKELLRQFPEITLTATDIDPLMIQEAVRHLPDSVPVLRADVTHLPFPDNSFDCVVSFIMLHHVIEWEKAVREIHRVLRPGGRFIGYDLVKTSPTVLLHAVDGSPSKMILADELRDTCDGLGFASIEIETAGLGQVMRFIAVCS